jgi:uncharacterized protein involved in type VI secretion and phage assembly
MHPLLNAMRLQAQRQMSESVSSRIGYIFAYNPNNYTARAILQPDLLHTGWLPIAAMWVGSQCGMYAAPNIGDMCKVQFVADDVNDGIIDGLFWNNSARPLAVPSGEFWLVHASGAFVKLTNDGKLTFSDGQGAQVQFDGAGNAISQAKQWTHTGAVNFNGLTIDTSGNLVSPGTVTGDVDVLSGSEAISGKGHKHGEVQSGGSETGGPSNT